MTGPDRGMVAADPDYVPYVPGSYVPPPKADCGHCTEYPAGWVDLNGRERPEPTLSRDSECPVHGIDADRSAWRAPDRLRVKGFTDELPEPPEHTRREADRDEARNRAGRARGEWY